MNSSAAHLVACAQSRDSAQLQRGNSTKLTLSPFDGVVRLVSVRSAEQQSRLRVLHLHANEQMFAEMELTPCLWQWRNALRSSAIANSNPDLTLFAAI